MTRSVEAFGATVEEAIQEALTELGVDAAAADVEVLQDAKRGLFGGAKRAHVRVTLRGGEGASSEGGAAAAGTTTAGDGSVQEDAARGATSEEDAVARAERDVDDASGTSAGEDDGAGRSEETVAADAGQEEAVETDTVAGTQHDETAEALSPEERMQQLDEEADMAADFVEGLLDLLDLPGDIEIEVQEEQAVLNIEDVGSGLLIGRRGATLDALQELVRCAVQRQTERRSHVRVDVEGYRGRQIDKLRDRCREAIAQVRETGEAVRLEPMDAYERKMMHDLVAKTGGVTSSSEGTEPKRRVVIHPAQG